MFNQKGFLSLLALSLIIVSILAVGVTSYLATNSSKQNQESVVSTEYSNNSQLNSSEISRFLDTFLWSPVYDVGTT